MCYPIDYFFKLQTIVPTVPIVPFSAHISAIFLSFTPPLEVQGRSGKKTAQPKTDDVVLNILNSECL